MRKSAGPQGVGVTDVPLFAKNDNDEAPYYVRFPLKATGLHTPRWSESLLQITSLVGVPIRFSDLELTGGEGGGETVALLSIDCDPTSATFGESLQHAGIDVLLARSGREDLHTFHVEALVAFVKTVLSDLVAFGDLFEEDEIEKMRPKAELAAAKATRAEFEVFYKSYLADAVAVDDGLKVVESPYVLTPFYVYMPRCVCGYHRGLDGASLSFCGRCKSVRYCSKECQKKDWTGHKKVCRNVESGASGVVREG